jgi:hypothetical protein
MAKVDDSGPNHGYWYVNGQDYYSFRAFLLNPWLGPEGPDSIPYMGSSISNHDLLALNGHDSLAAIVGVVDHEGYGVAATRRGHQAKLEDNITNVTTCANLAHPLERLAGDSADVEFEATGILDNSLRALGRAMSHSNVYGNHSNSPIYQWLPPWQLVYHNDPQTSDGPPNQDTAHCDWSGI